MRLELNEQEKQALLQLIDMAIKAGGLKVSEVGTILANRISALKEEEVKEVKKEEPKK